MVLVDWGPGENGAKIRRFWDGFAVGFKDGWVALTGLAPFLPGT
jgi:hypothetical protein